MTSDAAAFVRVDSPKDDTVHVDVRATPDATTSATSALTLEWRNVTLERDVMATSSGSADGANRVRILSDVNGFAVPGELLVVMGPSGAGKTTLLNVISGRTTSGLSADAAVTVNGQAWTKSSKRQLATYVMQDDLFYETLTVREHLLFQVRLRDEHATDSEQARVDQALRDYGLFGVRNSLIGGIRVRGISGGEKKRLSIASEVLGSASVFFVDEPTSGLDSSMAAAVVSQLKHIAQRGNKTVVATIHQPSSEIFAQFDKLYLLAAGQVAYHGPAAKAATYFAERGFQCPAFLNPADYFMMQLATTSPSPMEGDTERDADVASGDHARLELLTQAWEAYRHTERYASTVPQYRGDAVTAATSSDGSDGEPMTAALALVPMKKASVGDIAHQVATLARRNVVRLVRDKLGFRVAIMQSLMSAVIVGLVYLQLDMSQSGIQSFDGAFFFFTVSQVMITANGQFSTVPSELALISREYRAGLYHIASWYFAKNASELPLQILLPVVFYLPVYFLIGIGHGAEVFFYQQVLLVLLNSTAVGFGYMVSCLSKRADITPVLGIAMLMPMLLLGGLLINTDDIPVYLVWIEYISPFKYGYEALMTVFWTRVDSIPCSGSALTCSALTGEQVLRNFSMDGRSPWTSGVMLVVLNLAFRLVGLLSLAVSLNREDV